MVIRKTGLIILFVFAFAAVILPSFGQGLAAEAGEAAGYCDDAYGDEGLVETLVTDIEYGSISIYSEHINNGYLPQFTNSNENLSNVCANILGANIVGYYDRYYEQLIPNASAGSMAGNYFMYYPMSVNSLQKQAVINTFYSTMQTNVGHSGTTLANFKAGLEAYVSGKGLTLTYKDMSMGRSILDYGECFETFENGIPLIMFLSGYNRCEYSYNGEVFSITKRIYSGNHAVMVYGIEWVYFYDHNGNIMYTEIFLNFIDEQGHSKYLIACSGHLDHIEGVIISQ